MANTTSINPAQIYDLTMEFCTRQESKNYRRRLRRRGFILSVCKEALYHPTHWKNAGMAFPDGPGDIWLINDAFKALTPEARNWAASEE